MLCVCRFSDFRILKLILIFLIGLVDRLMWIVLLIFIYKRLLRLMVDFIVLLIKLFVLVMFRWIGVLVVFVSC